MVDIKYVIKVLFLSNKEIKFLMYNKFRQHLQFISRIDMFIKMLQCR